MLGSRWSYTGGSYDCDVKFPSTGSGLKQLAPACDVILRGCGTFEQSPAGRCKHLGNKP